MMNRFIRQLTRLFHDTGEIFGLALTILVCLVNLVTITPAGVVISEFMASNSSFHPDEDGDYPDWIELHNASATLVDLKGWHVTDDPSDLRKWSFPSTRFEPGSFLVVYASGKDRSLVGEELHTNFKLGRTGEYLALVRPNLTIAHEFAPMYPPQVYGYSYGLMSPSPTDDAPPTEGVQQTPTPGKPNGDLHAGFVEAVRCSPERGFYEKTFKLHMETRTRGAIIHYTLDGSEPTIETGFLYTKPITIDQTTVLRATALKTGLEPGPISTHTYLFPADVIRQSPKGQRPGSSWPERRTNNRYVDRNQRLDYGMDPEITQDPRYAPLMVNALLAVPALSLVTDSDNLFSAKTGIYVNAMHQGIEWERETSLELLNPDGTPGFQIDCGVRLRGGHSRFYTNPKHGFRLFFRARYGGKLRHPLFGKEGTDQFDNIDLRTSQNYSWAFENPEAFTMCREVFSRDLQRDMGEPYTRSEYYHLYINGHYWGLFQTQERSEASYAAAYFGGLSSDYDVIKAEGQVRRNFVVLPTDGDEKAWHRLWETMHTGFETDETYYKVQGKNPDGTLNPDYEELVDIDNLINYMLDTIYVGDPDGPVNDDYMVPNNFYTIRNRNGHMGFQFFRHDAEHSLDMLNEDRTQPTILGLETFWHFNPKVLHDRLVKHPDYRQRVADLIYKHFFNEGALTVHACIERFFARVSEVDLAVIAESARWGDAQSEKARTRDDDWRPQIDWDLNEYLPYRTDIVLRQLQKAGLYPDVGPAIFSQRGGAVAMGFELVITASTGTIYYTTDGTDPRLPGGRINSRARRLRTNDKKDARVTLNRTTHVKTRVLEGETWSALDEAVFTIGSVADSIRVSELMYNPPAWGGLTQHDPDEFEYLEIHNAGRQAVDLAGCRFVEGIEFEFPRFIMEPGRYAIICRDTKAFAARYGGHASDVIGEYSGRLHNAGETLRLVDFHGQDVLTLSYDDSFDSTDGEGHSLAPADPQANEPTPFRQAWRPSHRSLGSPGADDKP